MGRREPDVLGRACDLGVGHATDHICRDVGEDAGNGLASICPRAAPAGGGVFRPKSCRERTAGVRTAPRR